MATTTDILLAADAWSDDVAAGAAELIIQPDSGFTLIAYIGTTKPAADNREGIPIEAKGTRLGAPMLQPGDKVFLLSKTGSGSVTVIRSGGASLYVGQRSVGTAAVQLPAASLKNGVIITASPYNTAPIYVGGAGVTAVLDGAASGYPLPPGCSTSVAIADPSAISLISATAGQIATYIGS